MDKMQIDEFIITDVKGNLKINNKDFKLCESIITEKEKIKNGNNEIFNYYQNLEESQKILSLFLPIGTLLI